MQRPGRESWTCMVARPTMRTGSSQDATTQEAAWGVSSNGTGNRRKPRLGSVTDRVEPFCQRQVDRRTAGIPGVLAHRHTATLFVMLGFGDGPHSSGKGTEVR